MTSTSDTQSSRSVGQIKWFNNKAGYGFITMTDSAESNKDIFVHFSAIRVTNSQYKYLVQGEYVEFNLVKTTSGAHEYQATDVSGIKGGSLMCETRNTNRPPEESVQRQYRVPRDQHRGSRPNNKVEVDASQTRPLLTRTPSLQVEYKKIRRSPSAKRSTEKDL